MKNCVICGELLNDQNKSNEHIILILNLLIDK